MHLKTYGNIITQIVLSNLYKIKYGLECNNVELGHTLSGEKQSQGGAVLYCITLEEEEVLKITLEGKF